MTVWLQYLGLSSAATGFIYYTLAVMLKTAVILGALIVTVAWMPWFERKILARIQLRAGPTHVGFTGKYGLFQPIADGIKLLLKEDITPLKAFKPIYLVAPAIVSATALFTFSVVPFAGGEYWTSDLTNLAVHEGLNNFSLGYITNMNLAVLFV
ncbi:MAG: NADH-quinone oxidoreductase subunit H, partial [bacterium]